MFSILLLMLGFVMSMVAVIVILIGELIDEGRSKFIKRLSLSCLVFGFSSMTMGVFLIGLMELVK